MKALVVLVESFDNKGCDIKFLQVETSEKLIDAVYQLLGYEEDCDLTYYEWMESNLLSVSSLDIILKDERLKINVDNEDFLNEERSIRELFQSPYSNIVKL